MKLKFYLPALLMVCCSLQSCNDDNECDSSKTPCTVLTAFAIKYPAATATEWDAEYGLYKAEFVNNGAKAEAYFQTDGTWVRTETEFHGTLPEAVQTYLDTNYAGYYVEDQEYVETPTGDYYHIELEKAASPDVEINIKADGSLWTA